MSTQFTSLPNWLREFDSRRPLHASSQVTGTTARTNLASLVARCTRWCTLAVLAVVAFTAAAQGQALADGGPARWDKPVLTVRVADVAAWAGTDVQAALAGWSPAMPLVLTEAADADITLAAPVAAESVEGATAYTTGEGSTITSCTVVPVTKYAGTDQTQALTHEIGHCLGLAHNNGGADSVMYWIEGGHHWSTTVTATDVAAVKGMYR